VFFFLLLTLFSFSLGWLRDDFFFQETAISAGF
jgi:hypothetical protein